MRRALAIVLVLGLVACDGGGGGTDGGGGGSDGGGGGTDGGGGGMPVDVTMEARNPADQSPIAGAVLAVDLPDGSRMEQTADASGRVTFSIDWAAGPITVTGYAPGHTVFSAVGATAEQVAVFTDGGVLPIPLATNVVRTDLVTLSGSILNGTNPAYRYQVSANSPDGVPYNAVGPDYTMTVPPGVALRLTVAEYVQVFTATNDYTQEFVAMGTVDVGPLTADTTMDLDLTANPVTFTEVSGSVASPGMGTPLADATFYVNVSDLDTNEFLGAVTSATPNGANVDFTVGYLDVAGSTPFTRYVLQDDPLFSQVFIAGVPSGGALGPSFLPPPAIVSPAFGESHSIHAPFELGRVAMGVETSLILYDLNQEDRQLWQVASLGGAEMIAFPELPAGAPASDVLPSGADLYVRPLVCERTANNRYCDRVALGGRQFDLTN